MTPGAVESPLFPALAGYLDARAAEFPALGPDRRARLAEAAEYVRARRAAGKAAALLFVCTHNSRRSHLGQLWALAAAAACGMDGVAAFSGGTEATAFAPHAVDSLRRAGFRVDVEQPGPNPVYLARLGPAFEPVRCFSKTYDAPSNPRSGFCAVMTCAEADEACPRVDGAIARIALPYDDPKRSDGTGRETEVYDERCREIAREMLYAFSLARTVAP